MLSMTGFGIGSASANGWIVNTSVKTLNHRYLEIRIRGLEEYEELEMRSRKLLEGAFARGRVEAQVELDREGGIALTYDLGLAQHYWRTLKSLAEELELEGGVSLDHLIGLKGVLKKEEPKLDLWPLLEGSLRKSIAQAVEMRRYEGRNLEKELGSCWKVLQGHLQEIESRTPQVKLHFKDKLRERAEELFGLELDQERLEEEAVIFAERSDITEEIALLKSHLERASVVISSSVTVGKMLDFLAQEMYREVNTIGAKTRDVQIAQRAVEMKVQIEKVREQVRNIE